MRRIVIIGASHHNTLSVVRCVGEVLGLVDLVLIGCVKSFVAKSKYVRSATFLKDSKDLYQWAKKNKDQTNSIVISCADGVSQVFDVHYEELRPFYNFFNAGADGIITSFMNKQKQVELANQVGFVTPVSACYTRLDNVNNFAAFPCIVKPLQSYVGGKHIWHCNNTKELQDVLQSVPNGVMVQVQELINNKHEIVLPGLITKNDFIVPGYILKHREFLGGTTYSSVKKHNHQTQQLVSLSKAMLRKIGYEGLFGIEAMYNGKEYVFIELNLRNDATCYSLAVAGINLPVMYINSVVGGKIEFKGISEITSMVENKDFSHVIRRNIGFIQWIKEMKGANCKFLYNKNDKKPMFSCLISQITNKFHL